MGQQGPILASVYYFMILSLDKHTFQGNKAFIQNSANDIVLKPGVICTDAGLWNRTAAGREDS